jgi:hypothetical protein
MLPRYLASSAGRAAEARRWSDGAEAAHFGVVEAGDGLVVNDLGSCDCQRTLFVQSGGQPGARSAWTDERPTPSPPATFPRPFRCSSRPGFAPAPPDLSATRTWPLKSSAIFFPPGVPPAKPNPRRARPAAAPRRRATTLKTFARELASPPNGLPLGRRWSEREGQRGRFEEWLESVRDACGKLGLNLSYIKYDHFSPVLDPDPSPPPKGRSS